MEEEDMKQAVIAALLAAGAVFTIAPEALAQQAATVKSAPNPGAKYRVVFQVSDNDPAKWNLALNNAKNVQKDLGKDNVEIEIVAYGPGLNMLKAESAVAGRVNAALDDGVAVVACDNTMRNMKLNNADLIGGIGHVDAGVVELMMKQREGWAYIRP
jgi:intracellular sulfur oxidation DsrE/DsrF family protein